MRNLSCLVLLLWSSLAQAQIVVEQQYRVHNDAKHGVCWFCCAEMIGRKYGITPLVGLTTKVLESGIGRDHGADPASVAHWNETLHLKMGASNVKHPKAITDILDQGFPVIISMNRWEETNIKHAILILRMTRTKEDWVNPKTKQKIHDYLVDFIDPNHPDHDYTAPWGWCWRLWNGRATWYLPAEQAPLLVSQPQPVHVTPVDVGEPTGDGPPIYHPPVVPVEPVPGEVPVVAQPVPAVIPGQLQPAQYPPGQARPLTAQVLLPTEPPLNIPHNQLNDGVHRPLDTILRRFRNYTGYDYYAEHRARLNAAQAQLH